MSPPHHKPLLLCHRNISPPPPLIYWSPVTVICPHQPPNTLVSCHCHLSPPPPPPPNTLVTCHCHLSPPSHTNTLVSCHCHLSPYGMSIQVAHVQVVFLSRHWQSWNRKFNYGLTFDTLFARVHARPASVAQTKVMFSGMLINRLRAAPTKPPGSFVSSDSTSRTRGC